MSFNKYGWICKVNKDPFEPYEHYIDRGEFIVSQKPKNLEEYINILNLSRLYINIKYNMCKYSDDIMVKINTMIENMYTN